MTIFTTSERILTRDKKLIHNIITLPDYNIIFFLNSAEYTWYTWYTWVQQICALKWPPRRLPLAAASRARQGYFYVKNSKSERETGI